jgi:hypothetical protein
LLSLDEVAYRLSVSRYTVKAMMKRHQLEPVRICRRLLFDPASIEQLIARHCSQQSRKRLIDTNTIPAQEQ